MCHMLENSVDTDLGSKSSMTQFRLNSVSEMDQSKLTYCKTPIQWKHVYIQTGDKLKEKPEWMSGETQWMQMPPHRCTAWHNYHLTRNSCTRQCCGVFTCRDEQNMERTNRSTPERFHTFSCSFIFLDCVIAMTLLVCTIHFTLSVRNIVQIVNELQNHAYIWYTVCTKADFVHREQQAAMKFPLRNAPGHENGNGIRWGPICLLIRALH